MFEKLSEKKLKNLIVGVAVAGTLLLFVLICVVIFQFVSMGIKNSQIKGCQTAIEQVEQEIEKSEVDLSYYMTDEYKQIRAFQNGYQKPEDQDTK